MSPGEKLAGWRTQRGMSLRVLERLSGVNRSTILRWEKNATHPRRVEWNAVVAALGLEGDQLRAAQAELEATGSHFVKLETVPVGLPIDVPRGPLLRAIRMRSGKTLEEVGAAMGVHRSTLSRWENSATWPDPMQLQSFCMLCHATADEVAWLLASSESAKADPDEEALLRYETLGLPESLHDLFWIARIQLQETKARHQPATWDLWKSYMIAYGIGLSYRERHREAEWVVQQLMERDDLRWTPHDRLILSIIETSVYASRGPGEALNAANELQLALPLAGHEGYLNWAQADVALHYSAAGHHQEAQEWMERSLRTAHQASPTEVIWRQHDAAVIFTRAGEYREALMRTIAFARGEVGPLEAALEAIERGDALMGLGEIDLARSVFEAGIEKADQAVAPPIRQQLIDRRDAALLGTPVLAAR